MENLKFITYDTSFETDDTFFSNESSFHLKIVKKVGVYYYQTINMSNTSS